MRVRRNIRVPPIIPIQIGGLTATMDVDALIDTGATYCVISLDDAIGMGYEPWKDIAVSVATASGTITVPLIRVRFTRVLGFEIEDVETLVKDLEGVGVNAIVGWSFLRHFKFGFDLQQGVFEIEDF